MKFIILMMMKMRKVKKLHMINQKVSYYEKLAFHEITILPKSNIYSIKQYAKKYNLNPNLILAFVIIEKLNRGHIVQIYTEKLIAAFWPKLLIYLDASLGIGQLKISTAKKILSINDNTSVIKYLLDSDKNIEIMAKLIKCYNRSDNTQNLEYLVKLYTTGNKFANWNTSINIYYQLFCKIVAKQFFADELKFELKENEEIMENEVFREINISGKDGEYKITGEAKVYEGLFYYDISDGHVYLEEKTPVHTSEGGPNWGNFNIELSLDKKNLPINGTLMLELYETSQKDGEAIHLLSIPLEHFR